MSDPAAGTIGLPNPSRMFGPITIVYRVGSFEQALALANDSPYGLTASIHTRDIGRALAFVDRVQAGVAVVNGGTHGSEPHMPFGGVKASGNGTREPGSMRRLFTRRLRRLTTIKNHWRCGIRSKVTRNCESAWV